jgi:hypothetical protein
VGDDRLEAALFVGPPRTRSTVRPTPDFADFHRQRQQHPHLTQQLLWEESRWHEQIGDPTLADGILDRLVHNAHRIEMRGDSMRKNGGKTNI